MLLVRGLGERQGKESWAPELWLDPDAPKSVWDQADLNLFVFVLSVLM